MKQKDGKLTVYGATGYLDFREKPLHFANDPNGEISDSVKKEVTTNISGEEPLDFPGMITEQDEPNVEPNIYFISEEPLEFPGMKIED